MDIWDEIKKLSGYQSGNGGVDSYGVDHSGFSTRDELEYQSARLARENQLAEGFAKQGIAEENYPQYGTNFWGGSPENNYGFGTSNIKQNIENVTSQLNNNTNNGQVFANSDYTVNTESLVGKPSSYFQNNNTFGSATGRAIENAADAITAPNTTSSPIMEPINRYLASVLPQYTAPTSLGQNMVHTNVSSYPNVEKTTYDQFVQSDAYNQLRNFHILQEGYERTIDDNGMVFPYPDINGDITGCIGHNMKNDFNTHPWIDVTSGQSLSKLQMLSAEKKLKSLPTNFKSELYATETNARLPQEYCSDLYNEDIASRWNTLNKVITNWLHMSPEMQAATMDVHFTGNMEPKDSWMLAKRAAEKMNKRDYCDNLHRLDKRRDDIKRRNQWVSDMCMKGKFYR